MPDPMTPERLAEIEARLTVVRLGRSYAMETDADLRGIRDLVVEVRRLQAAVERVRELHAPVEVEPSGTICRECSFRLPNGRCFGKLVEHPCPTIAALDGDDQ